MPSLPRSSGRRHGVPRRTAACASLALLPAILLALPAAAGAQPRPRLAAAEPGIWLSGTVGLLQAETILDGRSNASWDFAENSIQYRATLETVVSPGTTIGVQGTWAPGVATTVRGLGLTDRPALDGCPGECAASADLLGVAAVGRIGGGQGVHQVIELTAGVQQLRNLRLDGGATLAPERDTDLHAALGYGIGYGFSARASMALVQEFGIVRHQRDFLPRDRNGITQQRVTRVTVRIGTGTRR